MGKTTGFRDYERKNADSQSVELRLHHYNEFADSLDDRELAQQGARCMDCGIPFCHSSYGCPVMNLIPEWNDLVYHDQWQEAYERLEMTNNFPEFTGRLCPAPCETACTLAINDAPVTIKQIELAIIEKAFSHNWIKPKPPDKLTGKSVAIIGSGPAGLAAAQQLCRAGHLVTVYEKTSKIGGLLRYGIPDFKMEKSIIDRRLEQLRTEGVTFITDVEIGVDISANYLKKNYDAILVATGAGIPRDLSIPGRELNGIHFAMDYLSRSNMYIDQCLPENQLISAANKNGLVIGGGDTGSDCVGTANRQGAKKVHQFEILPKPRNWTNSWNPEWPHWPDIMRMSSSHEEGCERDWAITTTAFSGSDKHIEKVNFKRVKWSPSTNGDKMIINEIEGSDFTMKFDLVLLAMGFLHVEQGRLLKELGVTFDAKGNIKTNPAYHTNISGVFSAGDASTGASLVVTAIHHGRQAADSVDEYLSSINS
jgi:glutamate synthase (NADPH/NADH) small chain